MNGQLGNITWKHNLHGNTIIGNMFELGNITFNLETPKLT